MGSACDFAVISVFQNRNIAGLTPCFFIHWTFLTAFGVVQTQALDLKLQLFHGHADLIFRRNNGNLSQQRRPGPIF